MTTCIIAEKPSVARDIARIVGATHPQDGFIEGCVKGALKPESFKRQLSQEEATKLCHCAYDTASAQYTDRAKWKRDLVRAGLSPNDQNQEIFQKLVVGLQSCAANQNLM